MRRHENRGPRVIDFFKQIDDRQRINLIEISGRLVGEEYERFKYDRSRYGDSLAFTA